MRPDQWEPPIKLSATEHVIVKRIRRAKLFIFLREHRHEVFDAPFQEELASLYQDSPRGRPPVAPALLALATILQAYTEASDDEVIEASVMDRRWQLVLDCLDTEEAPFSKGTLIAFRQRLIEANMDRRLIERTIEVARQAGAFGAGALRAALDSSPLWGAGRVEDTYNLLGHALRKALGVIAVQQGWELAEVATAANAPVVSGSSLKAALDRNWDDPQARQEALAIVLTALTAVESWLETQLNLKTAQQIKAQDVEMTQTGTATLRKGVAKERRISIEDAQMRHGRKSRSVRVDGYKRHVVHDLDSGLVRAVGITPANVPEASVTEAIKTDLAAQQAQLAELHIDRAYLSSSLVRERSADLLQSLAGTQWPALSQDRL